MTYSLFKQSTLDVVGSQLNEAEVSDSYLSSTLARHPSILSKLVKAVSSMDPRDVQEFDKALAVLFFSIKGSIPRSFKAACHVHLVRLNWASSKRP